VVGATLKSLDELLREPSASVVRAQGGAPVGGWALRVVVGSLVCCVLYGAAGGFFQGGAQVAIAALKAPLIVAWSAALCAPSLYVFGLLSGAALTRQRFLVTLTGFLGMISLVLVGLLPIEWLFSVSSKSLPFVVWLHLMLWGLALFFAARFLRAALPEVSMGAVLLWLALFCVVSFQVTTFLRPTLWRQPGGRLFDGNKLFFLEHFDKASSRFPGLP
jgi:hypothetical protein